MRAIVILLLAGLLFSNCKTQSNFNLPRNESVESLEVKDTVVINSDENTYEIIIIEPGFNAWFASTARPIGYYSQSFMEDRNQIFVNEWNLRVNQPLTFDPTYYELTIDYNNREDYGYDFNYKLYNYFIYFQIKHKQRLGPFEPRI
jgi:hypothetical protein